MRSDPNLIKKGESSSSFGAVNKGNGDGKTTAGRNTETSNTANKAVDDNDKQDNKND